MCFHDQDGLVIAELMRMIGKLRLLRYKLFVLYKSCLYLRVDLGLLDDAKSLITILPSGPLAVVDRERGGALEKGRRDFGRAAAGSWLLMVIHGQG